MKNNKQPKEESALIASRISDWLTTYLPHTRGNSPHTLRAYTAALRLYLQFLESEKSIHHTALSAKCFDASVVEEWMLWLKNARNCGNSTCNHRLACLRSFISYLGHIDLRFVEQENKLKSVKEMRMMRNGIVEITKGAMKALFAAIDQRTRTGKRDLAMFVLTYSTATRINEVLSLRIGDIRLNRKEIHDCIYVMGKGSKRRVIPIMKDCAKVLTVYVRMFHGETPNDNDLLFFTSHKGQRCKITQEAVNKRLKTYALKANKICAEMPINIHCHNLRAARASHWLLEGLNIAMIQKLLGHENINTTMRYVAVTTAQKSVALSTMEDDVSKSASKRWKKEKMTSPLATLLGLKPIKQ